MDYLGWMILFSDGLEAVLSMSLVCLDRICGTHAVEEAHVDNVLLTDSMCFELWVCLEYAWFRVVDVSVDVCH